MHVRTMPFSTPDKNLLQFIGMAVSALIAFVGLVLNYLNVSRAFARSGGQVFQVNRLTWQIDVVKEALSIVTIGSIAFAIVIQLGKMYQKRGKIASNFACFKKMAAKGARRVRQSFGGSDEVQLELPELQPPSAEPVLSLNRVGDTDRRRRLARLSMDRSEAASAGDEGAGDEVNPFRIGNPLNEVRRQTTSV